MRNNEPEINKYQIVIRIILNKWITNAKITNKWIANRKITNRNKTNKYANKVMRW